MHFSAINSLPVMPRPSPGEVSEYVKNVSLLDSLIYSADNKIIMFFNTYKGSPHLRDDRLMAEMGVGCEPNHNLIQSYSVGDCKGIASLPETVGSLRLEKHSSLFIDESHSVHGKIPRNDELRGHNHLERVLC